MGKITTEVRAFCASHSHAVLFDEDGGTLFDVSSAKTLPLKPAELHSVEQRTNGQTGGTYLVLRYSDGHEIALSDVGIAFAPRTAQTGPIPELPNVVCFRDYSLLKSRVEHAFSAHPEQSTTREWVQLTMACLAIVDGANAIGFTVDREQHELEALLGQLESRAGKAEAPSSHAPSDKPQAP